MCVTWGQTAATKKTQKMFSPNYRNKVFDLFHQFPCKSRRVWKNGLLPGIDRAKATPTLIHCPKPRLMGSPRVVFRLPWAAMLDLWKKCGFPTCSRNKKCGTSPSIDENSCSGRIRKKRSEIPKSRKVHQASPGYCIPSTWHQAEEPKIFQKNLGSHLQFFPTMKIMKSSFFTVSPPVPNAVKCVRSS